MSGDMIILICMMITTFINKILIKKNIYVIIVNT